MIRARAIENAALRHGGCIIDVLQTWDANSRIQLLKIQYGKSQLDAHIERSNRTVRYAGLDIAITNAPVGLGDIIAKQK